MLGLFFFSHIKPCVFRSPVRRKPVLIVQKRITPSFVQSRLHTSCNTKNDKILLYRPQLVQGSSLALFGLFLTLLGLGEVHAGNDDSAKEARFIPVDLPGAGNEKVVDPTKLGLVEDLAHPGWYRMNQKEGAFSVKVENGQLLWRAFGPIRAEDVREIVKFYVNLASNKHIQRRVHINTGVHGTEAGGTMVNASAGDFFKEDFESVVNAVYKHHHVSFHIVSSFAAPIPAKAIPGSDVVDAWCFSAGFQEGSKLIVENLLSYRELKRQFSLSYASDIHTTNSYIELQALKTDIKQQLVGSAFCYVKSSAGGFGKSRVALEFEKEVQNDIQNGSAQYVESVFISLKTSSGLTRFRNHLEAIFGRQENSETEVFERYFKELGFLAQKKNRKVFVVFDNIDTAKDVEELEKIYSALQKHAYDPSTHICRFDVLVTGRRNLTTFLENHEKIGKIIELENYWQESDIWNLFSASFVQGVGKGMQNSAQLYIEQAETRKHLLNMLKKAGNHPALTVVFAKLLSNKYFHTGSLETTTKLLEDNLQKMANQHYKPGDYGLVCNIADAQLSVLDQDWMGFPSKLFEIFALISDERVDFTFFQVVVEEYYKKKGPAHLDNLDIPGIMREMHDSGLICRREDRTYEMPKLYNLIVREKLSKNFQKDQATRDDVLLIISVMLNHMKTERDHLGYFLSLFNYANRTQAIDKKISEEINKKFIEYARQVLEMIPYEDATDRLREFLRVIPNTFGYKIDPVLYRVVMDRGIQDIAESVTQKVDALSAQGVSEDLIKALNNIYVFYVSKNDNNSAEKIKQKIQALLTNTQVNPSIAMVQENIHSTALEKLTFFSGITYTAIDSQAVSRITHLEESWNKTNNKKKADLSGKMAAPNLQLLGPALKVLIPSLLEQEVEEVDLSRTRLWYSVDAVEVVVELLKYPGSLKTLKLDGNGLRMRDGTYTIYVDSAFERIIEGMQKNTTLEKITISDSDLEDKHVVVLCTALYKHKKMQHIDLTHNRITEQGGKALLTLMEHNPHIHTIDTNCWRLEPNMFKGVPCSMQPLIKHNGITVKVTNMHDQVRLERVPDTARL